MSERRSLGQRAIRDLGVSLVLISTVYALAWALYWPAFGSPAGIQHPLHYNETYVWPMPWTLHQAAPGVPLPSPLTALEGDTISQSFRVSADHLAAVRVWLAGERGGERVLATLRDGPSNTPLHSGVFPLVAGGAGQYYTLTFPPIVDAAGREYVIELTPVDGTAIARVAYLDTIPGQLRLNEFPVQGDLDLGVYHHGRPGAWTLTAIGERLLPDRVRMRIRQYKPAAFKGPTFGALYLALAAGVGLLLWALCPPLRRWPHALAAWVAMAGVLSAVAIAFRWDAGALTLLGPKIALSDPVPGPASAEVGASVRDLVAGLEFGGRKPEPRQVHAQVRTVGGERRACIAVPARSEVSFGLYVLPDAELRLGLGLPEGASEPLTFEVRMGKDLLWERTVLPSDGEQQTEAALSLSPYAGRLVTLILRTHRGSEVPEFGGMPPAGPLAVAGLWCTPRIVSERPWLLSSPPLPGPQRPQAARFGDEIELLGYDLDQGDARPGGIVQVALYWRALRPLEASYTVSLHLLDAEGQIRGQWDTQPLNGTYPTDIWPTGSVVRDEIAVPIAGDAPPGEYVLAVGWYDLATMGRLHAVDQSGAPLADGQILLDSAVSWERD
ncbi:MAG: hypothetical protein ISS56_11565 [Anaerolineae bacterium]|nr:hypothetical protein [Anaerolineae bacterium]